MTGSPDTVVDNSQGSPIAIPYVIRSLRTALEKGDSYTTGEILGRAMYVTTQRAALAKPEGIATILHYAVDRGLADCINTILSYSVMVPEWRDIIPVETIPSAVEVVADAEDSDTVTKTLKKVLGFNPWRDRLKKPDGIPTVIQIVTVRKRDLTLNDILALNMNAESWRDGLAQPEGIPRALVIAATRDDIRCARILLSSSAKTDGWCIALAKPEGIPEALQIVASKGYVHLDADIRRAASQVPLWKAAVEEFDRMTALRTTTLPNGTRSPIPSAHP